jgi:hypothetical protein
VEGGRQGGEVKGVARGKRAECVHKGSGTRNAHQVCDVGGWRGLRRSAVDKHRVCVQQCAVQVGSRVWGCLQLHLAAAQQQHCCSQALLLCGWHSQDTIQRTSCIHVSGPVRTAAATSNTYTHTQYQCTIQGTSCIYGLPQWVLPALQHMHTYARYHHQPAREALRRPLFSWMR